MSGASHVGELVPVILFACYGDFCLLYMFGLNLKKDIYRIGFNDLM